MKRAVVFVLGVVVGQWLAAAAPTSQAERRSPAVQTLERRDATGAWTPEWPAPLSGRVVGSWLQLVGLPAGVATGGDEVAVPLELARGVWMAHVSLNGGRPARFLVDTGSSVVIVAPPIAAAAGVAVAATAPRIELQTVAGRSSGPAVRVRTIRVGDLQLTDVPIVVHDPGPGFDGILGNAFLSRYRLTLDPDRHLLVLRPLDGRGDAPHASRGSNAAGHARRPSLPLGAVAAPEAPGAPAPAAVTPSHAVVGPGVAD